MFPGASLLTGGGGLSGSSSASSDATGGAVGFGGFNFQPKGGSFPPQAWIAIAVAGVALILFGLRKR